MLPDPPSIVDSQVFQDYECVEEKNADDRTNWDVALERCVQLLSQ